MSGDYWAGIAENEWLYVGEIKSPDDRTLFNEECEKGIRF